MSVSEPPIPSARPIAGDVVAERSFAGWWAFARATGMVAVLGVVWWATGLDLMFGAIVAVTALAGLERRSITGRRAGWSLMVTAVLVLVGVVGFGRAGIGWSTGDRIAQGAIGLGVAAGVWLIALVWSRRSSS